MPTQHGPNCAGDAADADRDIAERRSLSDAPLARRSRDLADRFAAVDVELVRAAHPDALGEAER